MEPQRKRRRPSYGPSLRSLAVTMARSGDLPQKDVAKQIGCTSRQLRRWIRQADIDEGRRPGLKAAERHELAKLRRENLRLTRQIELMQEAQAFFASETR